MCLNVFPVYMLVSHVLCVRLTYLLIKGHLFTYIHSQTAVKNPDCRRLG